MHIPLIGAIPPPFEACGTVAELPQAVNIDIELNDTKIKNTLFKLLILTSFSLCVT